MVEICINSFETKREAERCERYYIESLGATLNRRIPTRTIKEYYESHKEEFKEYHKRYHVQNAEKISEQRKQSYVQNAEQISEQRKQYYVQNVEKISEQKKQYYVQNAEQISEQRKQYYNLQKQIKIARDKLFDIDI
jgi:hypothetical protein